MKKDFTQEIFILVSISNSEEDKISNHRSEKTARKTMRRKRYDPNHCVIVCISSKGIQQSHAKISYMRTSTGSINMSIAHKGDNISLGIAKRIRDEAGETHGNNVRNAANNKRHHALPAT